VKNKLCSFLARMGVRILTLPWEVETWMVSIFYSASIMDVGYGKISYRAELIREKR
jgi:hypothetical protein